MTSDQQIVVKDLGEAAPIDSQVQQLLAALRSPVSIQSRAQGHSTIRF